MGFAETFAYRTPADVFREHAALSAFENDGTRDFDLGDLSAISDADYDALAPVQWPISSAPPARGRTVVKGDQVGVPLARGVVHSVERLAMTRVSGTPTRLATRADLPLSGGGLDVYMP
jgi:assimilatory nitrate reductase catalytic subunit